MKLDDLFYCFDQLDFQSGPLTNGCMRLMHGRGKEFPGLEHVTIEWFPPYLVIIFHRPFELAIDNRLREYFTNFPAPQIQAIFIQKREAQKVTWETLKGVLPDGPVVVREGDFKFLIKLGEDQNVGLFLDMAPLRQWLLQHVCGKKILNLFSYTCSLSVASAMGKAREIHNVDMRKNFLTWGRHNHVLNECHGDFYHPLDVLKSFGRFKRLGPFDLVIIDPPTHQESFTIERDYARILKRVGEWLVGPAGTLIVVANDPVLSRDEFQTMVTEKLGNSFQFMGWGQAPQIMIGHDANFPVKVAFYERKICQTTSA